MQVISTLAQAATSPAVSPVEGTGGGGYPAWLPWAVGIWLVTSLVCHMMLAVKVVGNARRLVDSGRELWMLNAATWGAATVVGGLITAYVFYSRHGEMLRELNRTKGGAGGGKGGR